MAVAAHQRARLRAAMIEACANEGYAATTVHEIAAIAGVAKKTLYQRYGGKEECFLATYDLVVGEAVERISAAYRGGAAGTHDWSSGLCRAFDAFAAELIHQPARSRLALVEVLGAGPRAVKRIEDAEAIFVAMIRQSLKQAPDALAIPPGLTRPLIGGVWFVGRNRLLEGRAEEFADCGAEFGAWLLSYRRAGAIPFLSELPSDPRAHVEPPSASADERGRILRAAAVLIARGGYGALTEAEISELADIDPTAFSAHFDDVGTCFFATLDYLSARALARAIRDSAGAPEWAGGVCLAVRSLLRQIATDRALARAAFVDSFAAGPAGSERRGALLRGFANVLLRRAPADLRPSPLVAEAIVGAIWSLVQRQVVRGQAHRLPALANHAAFLALAPTVGAEEALATIGAERTATADPRSPS